MPFGRTPLHVACRSPGSVAHLLPSNDLNTLDDHGFTPLYTAANLGNEEAVGQLLAQEGIDASLADKGGLTPFHIACYSPHSGVGIVSRLLEKDEELEGKKDSIGRTGLDWAREKGRDVVVEYLTGRVRMATLELTEIAPVRQEMVTEVVKLCGGPIDVQCPVCGVDVGKRPGGLHPDHYKCESCSFVDAKEEFC
jgi:hypothetical protein